MRRFTTAAAGTITLLTLCASQGCVTYQGIAQGPRSGSYLVCETHDYLIFKKSMIVEYEYGEDDSVMSRTKKVR